MDDDYQQIANIVSQFAHCVDAHEWAAVGKLFSRMTYKGGAGAAPVRGEAELAAMYKRVVTQANQRFAADPEDARTVRHKHVFTNLLIDISKDRRSATCSYYGTVLAFSNRKPLQPRYSGRYYDRFECVNGKWRIIERLQVTDYFFGPAITGARSGVRSGASRTAPQSPSKRR